MEVVLETKNLCKSFGAVMVNDKINLTLHRGEIMAFWVKTVLERQRL